MPPVLFVIALSITVMALRPFWILLDGDTTGSALP
jgi:hypothetical protein